MPSPEHRGGEPNQEREAYPEYSRAARYQDGPSAGEVYFQAQAAVFATTFDMSAYRFQLEQTSYVAVLGDAPSAEFDETIQAILATGEPVTLPADILLALNLRRIQARNIASWVERHYRPGKPIGG